MKKNLMKRIVAMITAAVMLFSLAAFAACSKKQDDTHCRTERPDRNGYDETGR